MKTENGVTSKGEWSGYKLATVLISILSILVIFFQAIYNNYYNQRWKEIEYCESKINTKQNELIRLKEIPKVFLKTNTLEQSGLSKEMLRSLSAIPSTVSIEHAGGSTVEGILLEINSKEPISQFQKWDSPEEFSIDKDNMNSKKLILTAKRLREGTKIGFTLLTSKPTEIETDLIIDKGKLIEKKGSESYSYGKNFIERIEILSPNSVRKININDLKSLSDFRTNSESEEIIELEKEIFLLNEKIERLKSQSLWRWILPEINSYFFIIILIPILIFVFSLLIIPDFKKRSRRLELINDIKVNNFKPTDIFKIFETLGCPDDLKYVEDKETQKIELNYFSNYEFLPSKGVRFVVLNQQLDEIYDEKEREVIKKFA